MEQPADTFAAFLAVLATALDDHAVTGAELARRVHLSRHHFDRVIAATAGEAPGRFRRRVLLERAAHRLGTSTATILDVAVEAGYSSHEAFTRAFTRAYGRSPSQWRRSPGPVPLAAPSHVHFHPPGSLRLPATRKVTSMDLVVTMVEHHTWLVGQMLARAASLPDERLDAPIRISVEGIDHEPTLRSLLARLVGQMAMWHAAIAGEAYDVGTERDRSIEEIRAQLADVGPAFLAHVRDGCEQGRLEDAIVCPGDRVEVYTLGGVIAHVLTYAAHRRTLVAGALADAGVDDLDDDPVRWVGAAA